MFCSTITAKARPDSSIVAEAAEDFPEEETSEAADQILEVADQTFEDKTSEDKETSEVETTSEDAKDITEDAMIATDSFEAAADSSEDGMTATDSFEDVKIAMAISEDVMTATAISDDVTIAMEISEDAMTATDISEAATTSEDQEGLISDVSCFVFALPHTCILCSKTD